MNELTHVNTIGQLLDFAYHLHPCIGDLGGRRFMTDLGCKNKDGKTFCLNDLVAKFNALYQASKKEPDEIGKARNLLNRISVLNYNAVKLVQGSNVIIRILTAIRGLWGSIFFKRGPILGALDASISKKENEIEAKEIEIQAEEQKQLAIQKQENESKKYTDLKSLVEKAIDQNSNDKDLVWKTLTDEIKDSYVFERWAICKKIFNEFKGDSEKFLKFAHLFNYCSPICIAVQCDFLESLDWPANLNKDEEMKKFLLFMFHGGIERRSSVQVSPSGASIKINENDIITPIEALLDIRKIIGTGNYNPDIRKLSPNLLSAYGTVMAAIAAREFTQGNSFKIIISQFYECRFPGSQVAPFLPYLVNIPNLVAIDLSDIGVDKDSQGFTDIDYEALCQIIDTSPCLIDIKINTKGMSPEIEAKFYEKVNQRIAQNIQSYHETFFTLYKENINMPSPKALFNKFAK